MNGVLLSLPWQVAVLGIVAFVAFRIYKARHGIRWFVVGMAKTIWQYKVELTYMAVFYCSFMIAAAYAVMAVVELLLYRRFQFRLGLVAGLLGMAACIIIDRYLYKPKAT